MLALNCCDNIGTAAISLLNECRSQSFIYYRQAVATNILAPSPLPVNAAILTIFLKPSFYELKLFSGAHKRAGLCDHVGVSTVDPR